MFSKWLRVVIKWLRGTGHRASGFQVAARHQPQDDFSKWVRDKWLRGTGYKTSCFQKLKRHRSEGECFPSGYEWLSSGYEAPVTGRVVSKWRRDTSHKMISRSGYEIRGYEVPVTRRVASKSFQRHCSEGECFPSGYEWVPSGYEAPVTGRVVSKCWRDNSFKMIFSQMVSRHRSQDTWLPNGYEAPVTGRAVSK